MTRGHERMDGAPFSTKRAPPQHHKEEGERTTEFFKGSSRTDPDDDVVDVASFSALDVVAIKKEFFKAFVTEEVAAVSLRKRREVGGAVRLEMG